MKNTVSNQHLKHKKYIFHCYPEQHTTLYYW